MTNPTKEKCIRHNVFEENSKKHYNKLQAQLQDLKQRRKSKPLRWFCVLLSVFMAVFLMYFYYIRHAGFNIVTIIFSIAVSALFGSFMIVYVSLILEMRESRIRREILELDAVYAQNDVEEDIFENSIKMSYKYLDQYYLQTREQAQRGFFVTVCVAVFGAVLVGGGIIAMFFGSTEPSYITCAAGVITEFIATIFFYLYNKTVSSMSKYHNKLVLSQNVSIALKVSDSLPPDEKVKTKNLIVTELLKDINCHLIKDESDTTTNK